LADIPQVERLLFHVAAVLRTDQASWARCAFNRARASLFRTAAVDGSISLRVAAMTAFHAAARHLPSRVNGRSGPRAVSEKEHFRTLIGREYIYIKLFSL
jgi:hypothetical protein